MKSGLLTPEMATMKTKSLLDAWVKREKLISDFKKSAERLFAEFSGSTVTTPKFTVMRTEVWHELVDLSTANKPSRQKKCECCHSS